MRSGAWEIGIAGVLAGAPLGLAPKLGVSLNRAVWWRVVTLTAEMPGVGVRLRLTVR